uniref:Uncharacterized protein n=1 Tax=Triticum urartu TaxID=4572 RepID=A0A8R7V0S6_TRIUA
MLIPLLPAPETTRTPLPRCDRRHTPRERHICESEDDGDEAEAEDVTPKLCFTSNTNFSCRSLSRSSVGQNSQGSSGRLLGLQEELL